MANSAEKISVYNLADLKNTSDDAIPNYLNSLKFKQSHYLTDVRLAIGYSAFAIAGACFLWDYKFGFESTKAYTAVAVLAYTILNNFLTVWTSHKEKGTVYNGTAPSGETINIATSTKKGVPTYNLTVSIISKASEEPHTIQLAKPFADWFDETGVFVAVPFQEMLASSVPLIGKRDTKRVKASQDLLDADPELLNAILAANSASAVGSSTAADAVGKKNTKRRKA